MKYDVNTDNRDGKKVIVEMITSLVKEKMRIKTSPKIGENNLSNELTLLI